MSEQLFDVVFFGILQPGKEKEAVMKNMAALFKTDTAKLAPYFAGGRKVIKGKINAAAAEKYKIALENVGLTIKLEECAEQQAETDKPTSQASTEKAADNRQQRDAKAADTDDLTVAPVGVDVIENPVEPVAQKIADISSITVAEVGTDVLEHPTEVTPQEIDDIDASLAEVGADVLEHPAEVEAQEIEELEGVSLAEAGADLVENPKPTKKPDIDTSSLTLDDEAVED